MKIKAKLFATFREGRGKEIFYDMEPGSQVKDVLTLLGISIEEIAILLVNGKDAKVDTELYDEDYLSLFPPVGGG